MRKKELEKELKYIKRNSEVNGDKDERNGERNRERVE
jgi:hypothetical protein